MMDDDPLNAVYSYVERAYIRLQAGDLLIHCLEESSVSPIQQLVEGLVLAGPASINSLREILSETGRRKSQVRDDLRQLMLDLQKSLKSYGVEVNGEREPSQASLNPEGLQEVIDELDDLDPETRKSCLQLLKDSRDLISNLNTHLLLLEEIEIYLQDWLWGVVYQSAHQDSNQLGLPHS